VAGVGWWWTVVAVSCVLRVGIPTVLKSLGLITEAKQPRLLCSLGWLCVWTEAESGDARGAAEDRDNAETATRVMPPPHAEIERRRRVFSQPRTDQTTYFGRLQHFVQICWPPHMFLTRAQLDEAQALVDAYLGGSEPFGTTEEDVWCARHKIASAIHPDTGELMNVGGRMCFQPTGSSLLSSVMLTWGLTSTRVQLLLQWINQSYMALLNFSNRNATRDGPEMRNRMLSAYVLATGGSFVAAMGFGRLALLSTGNVAKKLVPMGAVAVSTAINVPIMRSQELQAGVSVQAENGATAAHPSRAAAKMAVGSVCFTRVLNATADLIIPPLLVAAAQRRGYSWAFNMRALMPVYLVSARWSPKYRTRSERHSLERRLLISTRVCEIEAQMDWF
jgi:hypothetical protein